jgi:hypothetical protein
MFAPTLSVSTMQVGVHPTLTGQLSSRNLGGLVNIRATIFANY